MKIQIKFRWSDRVIFEGEYESTRAAVLAAISSGVDLSGADLSDADLSGADLSGANLRGADLRGADLSVFKADLISETLKLPNELEGIRDALAFGKIDGSTYSTAGCSCLAGTIAKQRGIDSVSSGSVIEENGCQFQVDADSPRERWFMNIREGNTPENSEFARLAHEWICEAIMMRDHIRQTPKVI